ncbi:MAG: hypothetical protein ACM34A_08840, partial [Bacillota bacterium]
MTLQQGEPIPLRDDCPANSALPPPALFGSGYRPASGNAHNRVRYRQQEKEVLIAHNKYPGALIVKNAKLNVIIKTIWWRKSRDAGSCCDRRTMKAKTTINTEKKAADRPSLYSFNSREQDSGDVFRILDALE